MTDQERKAYNLITMATESSYGRLVEAARRIGLMQGAWVPRPLDSLSSEIKTSFFHACARVLRELGVVLPDELNDDIGRK